VASSLHILADIASLASPLRPCNTPSAVDFMCTDDVRKCFPISEKAVCVNENKLENSSKSNSATVKDHQYTARSDSLSSKKCFYHSNAIGLTVMVLIEDQRKCFTLMENALCPVVLLNLNCVCLMNRT